MSFSFKTDTPASKAATAGQAGNVATAVTIVPSSNEVLGKECQRTEFFTQETQDKQEAQETQKIQEAQDPQAAQERQETKEIHVIHDRKALTEKDSVDGDAQIMIEAAIVCSRLPGVETFLTHGFELARRIRGIELRYQFRCGPMLLRRIFDRWQEQNRQYLTDGRDYYSDFLAMMSKVRFPQNYLKHVLEITRTKTTPTRALSLPPPVQLLAKLCRELQTLSDKGTFYLACRAVGDLFACSHTTAANWLRALAFLEIVKLVSLGNPDEQLASEYRYIACD